MTTHTVPTRRKPECKMALHVERRPHVLLVAIKGEADFDQAGFIAAQLVRTPLEAYSLVVLDLAELTFLSAVAMGAMVGALLLYRRALWRRGVEVRLANVQAQVWSTLESAGLGGLFQPIDLEAHTLSAAITRA